MEVVNHAKTSECRHIAQERCLTTFSLSHSHQNQHGRENFHFGVSSSSVNQRVNQRVMGMHGDARFREEVTPGLELF